MNSRTYLSIGDVLSLLREEFPDVTISKIRFLESQGLVDPERSPSGYRKFYEQDVARLRWVLRKQRDQFLPLKVIRDRLAAAGTGVPPEDEPSEEAAPAGPAQELHTGAVPVGAHVAAGALGGSRSQPSGARGAAGGSFAPHSRSAEVLGANGAGADAGTPSGEAAEADVGATTVRATRGASQPSRSDERQDDERRRTKSTAEEPIARHSARGARAEPREPSRAPAHAPGAMGVTPPRSTGRDTVPASSAANDVLAASVSGVSLTLAELCAASGLTSQTVSSLESLGLVSPMSIAGGAFYDEEALTVTKLVAAFARFGIEPRHLRLFRNAADREVGLVEQVVAPLLRQRNPEARQRAVEAAAELARLGQGMRSALVRSELHRQLGT